MTKRKEIIEIEIKDTTLGTGNVRTKKPDIRISKQSKEKLSIDSLKNILNCMQTIDFLIEYYKGTKTVNAINSTREELRKLEPVNDPFDANVIYLEIVLEEYEPNTEAKVDIIIKNLIKISKRKGCRLGTINNIPCYYNNFYWEELSEDFMKDYLYFIAKKNGFTRDPYKTITEFIYPLYKQFQNLSTIQTTEIISNKEKIEFQKKKKACQGMDSLKLFPN